MRRLAVFLVLILHSFHPVHAQRRGKNQERLGKISSRLTHGEDAPEGRFPYMCSLRARGSREHRCGGTLIRRRWILTAAHCVDPNYENSVGTKPLVYCNIHNVDDNDPDTTFLVVDAYIHESWKGDTTKGYDIALLKLDRKAKLKPAGINDGGVVVEHGRVLTAIGWGKTEIGGGAEVLKMASTLPFITQRGCNTYYKKIDLKEHMICAGLHVQDTCDGDSGGPLLIPDAVEKQIENGNSRYDLVVGVTSFGRSACDASAPGIYTNVAYFYSWIAAILGEEIKVPVTSAEGGGDSSSSKKGSSAKKKHNEKETQSVRKPKKLTSSRDKTKPKPENEETEVKSNKKTRPVKDPRTKTPSPVKTRRAPQKEAPPKRKSTEQDTFNELNGLSKKELIQEMVLGALQFDDPAKAEAILMKGVGVNAVYDNSTIAAVGIQTGSTFLHWAAYYNAKKCIKVLLNAGAAIEKRNAGKHTPLLTAAWEGHSSAIKVLLKAGANMEAVATDGNTPLHVACTESYAKVVKVLLDNGAEPNARNALGLAPIHLVGARFSPLILRHLLDAGAEIDIRDPVEHTALHWAAVFNQTVGAKGLVDSGADIDAQRVDGSTPLHIASSKGFTETVIILVVSGASKTVTDDRGRTPLEVVCTDSDVVCSDSEKSGLEFWLR